jgi:endogenous inhibitor of DNA gyrase (YacG/DUF329 family)
MKICPGCQKRSPEENSYCPFCGNRLPSEPELPTIGEWGAQGLYRIVFPPQEEEFSSEDAALEAVRRSAWDGDREFEGAVSVTLVRSTVTKETHPFQCSNCRKTKGFSEPIVAPHRNGRCEYCGQMDWEPRT